MTKSGKAERSPVRLYLFFVTFALAILGSNVSLGAAQFRASVVKIDITPDKPQWLLGYGPRQSTGVHDHLFHRIVAMDDGTTQFYPDFHRYLPVFPFGLRPGDDGDRETNRNQTSPDLVDGNPHSCGAGSRTSRPGRRFHGRALRARPQHGVFRLGREQADRRGEGSAGQTRTRAAGRGLGNGDGEYQPARTG